MEKILEILKSIRSDVDFENEKALIDDGILDSFDVVSVVGELCDEFDHTFLVEEGSLKPATIAALEAEGFTLKILPFRTTAENLARCFAERLIAAGLPVCQIDMYETPNNCATYYVS